MNGNAYRWLPLFFAVFVLSIMKDSSAQGAAPAIITGRVTLDDGRPAAGENVIVRSTDYVSPAPSGTAVTDADGHYRVSIDTDLFPSLFANAKSSAPPPDAHFTVIVRIGRKLYLEPSSRAVTSTPGQTTDGIDFVVTTGSKVTVRIHDALTGLPVPGVQVQDNRYGSRNGNPMLGATDAHGITVFRLPALNANLVLSLPGGKTPTVQVAPGYLGYKELWLKEAQDVVWDVKTYSNPLPTTMLWQGTVLEPNGSPATAATVHLLRRTETITKTDSQGRFSVSLPPLHTDEADSMGRLTVAVLAEQGKKTALLVPTPEAVWGGMTLRLTETPLSSITGTVIDAQGRPEAGVPVICYEAPLTSETILTRKAENRGVTDSEGRFTITGLPAGRFRLSLGGGLFGCTNVPSGRLSFWEPGSQRLLVAGRQMDLGRIVVPVADQTLTGRLVTDTGHNVQDPGRPNGESNIWLTITGTHSQPIVHMDADGYLHVTRLVTEPLMMTISAWFPNGTNGWTVKEVARVPVQAGLQDVRVVVPAAALPPHSVVSTMPATPADTSPR